MVFSFVDSLTALSFDDAMRGSENIPKWAGGEPAKEDSTELEPEESPKADPSKNVKFPSNPSTPSKPPVDRLTAVEAATMPSLVDDIEDKLNEMGSSNVVDMVDDMWVVNR